MNASPTSQTDIIKTIAPPDGAGIVLTSGGEDHVYPVRLSGGKMASGASKKGDKALI